MGFFSKAEVTSRPPLSLSPKCGACGLHKQCYSPKMPVTGSGRRGILVVAEAPGEEEDRRGVQLVGQAGQYLRESLENLGVDLDRDCWKTNALICRPPENRTPTDDEITYCRPNLINAIKELHPRQIILLGASAVQSMLGLYWKEATGGIGLWAGWSIPFQPMNCWICPNYHPSYVLRSEQDRNGQAVKVWFERFLAKALMIEGRPWETVPDYESDVRLVYDTDQAAEWIYRKLENGAVSSFDYETDRLKPDHPDAEIVSCAICWRGEETIAFPFYGAVVDAMREYVRSPFPKIGANNKFENRWSRRILGERVRNFIWDTVNDAHILDNRDGITSVKFQAFVRLGFPDWSYAIRSYFDTDGDNERNRIRQIDLRTLLIYNGIDALVEYKIAQHQKKELGNAILEV